MIGSGGMKKAKSGSGARQLELHDSSMAYFIIVSFVIQGASERCQKNHWHESEML